MASPTDPTRPEAIATVTECRYEAGALQALAFGIPTRRHFLITFNYWAPNREGLATLHTGQYASAKAVPQGTLFPITYDAESPHLHDKSSEATRSPLITIGFLGSIILALAWLAFARGCA